MAKFKYAVLDAEKHYFYCLVNVIDGNYYFKREITDDMLAERIAKKEQQKKKE